MAFSDTAQIALRFAQQHDWGRFAKLAIRNGAEVVTGLVERWSDGTAVPVELAARRSVLADFGGY